MMKRLILIATAFSAFVTFGYGKISALGISVIGSASKYEDKQYPNYSDAVYGWRFAIISGAHKKMIGLSTAIVGNDDGTVGGYVGGLQIATIFNRAGSGEFGLWQLSAIHNEVSEGCNGFQCCVFGNASNGYFNGLQIALGNDAKGDIYGAQIGAINQAENIYGMQIGLINIANDGVQLGCYNYSSRLRGMQLGAINYAEECIAGFQIGVVNIIIANSVAVMPLFNCCF